MAEYTPEQAEEFRKKWAGEVKEEYTEEEIKELRGRWMGLEDVVNELINILKGSNIIKDHDRDEAEKRMKEANDLLKHYSIPSLDYICDYYSKIGEFNYYRLDLRGIDLSYKDCKFIFIPFAHFECSHIYAANFHQASMAATIWNYANLRRTHFDHSDLSASEFLNSDLYGTDFRNAIMSEVKWNSGYRITVRRLIPSFERRNTPKIEKTLVAGASFANSRAFERYIKDEQYIQELKENAKTNFLLRFVLGLWNITCDYGRSFFRWSFWCLFFVTLFGFIFADYTISPKWGFIADFADSVNPQLNYALDTAKTWYSPYYFSIVTFTTLGFGDVTPLNLAGQVWITLEVILGYVMLGGLISIFANKLARRA